MHVDPEVLALLALGEDAGTETERRHVETCPACSAELTDLRRVVVLGRSLGDAELEVPAPAVWARIREELATAPEAPASQTTEPAPTDLTADRLTAYARLAPVSEDWPASGSAELGTDERGRRLLQLVLHSGPTPSGVRQAWLVHRDDPARRHSLGMLDGPHGVWTVDHSIDLRAYAVVAVSESGATEDDATEDHAGERTVVRGELVLAG